MSPRRSRSSAPADGFIAVPLDALPPRTDEEAALQRDLYERALEEARRLCEPSAAWLDRFAGPN